MPLFLEIFNLFFIFISFHEFNISGADLNTMSPNFLIVYGIFVRGIYIPYKHVRGDGI